MHSLVASFSCSHACHVLSILCTVCSLVSLALVLALLLLSFSRLCTVCSLVSDALLLAFCNLSLAFIADLTLSDCKTRMRFVALSGKLCSAFLLARKTCWQDLHTFSLIGTIVSHCGHTLLGCMIEKSATHELEVEDVFSLHEKQNGRFPPWSNIECACAFSAEINMADYALAELLSEKNAQMF